jgi:hypothetical protein
MRGGGQGEILLRQLTDQNDSEGLRMTARSASLNGH